MTTTQVRPHVKTIATPAPPQKKPDWMRPVWAVARVVVRHPYASPALMAVVTAFTPITASEVTCVVVGGCSAIGYRSYRYPGSPAGEPSLQAIAKFRKQQRLVRQRWVTFTQDAGLAKVAVNGMPDKRRPRLLKVTREPLGVRLLVDGSRVSAGPDTFQTKIDLIRACFKAKHAKVEASGHNVFIHLRYEEPFKRPIRVRELPPPSEPGRVVVGLDEDGAPLEKDLRLPNLFVGAQGAGKSSEVWTILHAIVESRIPFRLRGFDPKGGQEYVDLEDVAWEYERNPTHWPQFLSHAHSALAARQAAMRAQRMRGLTTFTDEFPLDVMVIDELLTALAFGAGNTKVQVAGKQIGAEDAFMTYLSTCRSAGFTVLASSQLAQKDVIGKVRGLFPYATCLRVAPTEKEMVDALLGSGASKAYPAHQLPPTPAAAGIGFASTPTGIRKYRAAYLTDRERAAVVRGVGAWSKRLKKDVD